jgi:hypothetical protein
MDGAGGEARGNCAGCYSEHLTAKYNVLVLLHIRLLGRAGQVFNTPYAVRISMAISTIVYNLQVA